VLLSRAVPEKTTTAPQLGKITQSDTDCTGSDSLVSASHVDPSGGESGTEVSIAIVMAVLS
jgi:hypothetical protein